MMETRLIPKKFLKLIKNLADENRNYKKIFGNVFWLEVVKEKNYSWFNLRLNSTGMTIGMQYARFLNSQLKSERLFTPPMPLKVLMRLTAN